MNNEKLEVLNKKLKKCMPRLMTVFANRKL